MLITFINQDYLNNQELDSRFLSFEFRSRKSHQLYVTHVSHVSSTSLDLCSHTKCLRIIVMTLSVQIKIRNY